MKFAQEYVDNVLAQNFDDFKTLFVEQLIDIHYAHLIMLHEVGVIQKDDARALVQGLDALVPEEIREIAYDGQVEDVFFCIESLLERSCGPERAGRLHTARSRNDIDATLYRLRWRVELLSVAQAAFDLRRTLVELSHREKETLIPLYTHTQTAQPSTVAHYLLGVVEFLERDHVRLRSALTSMNRSPLGSCAITGTGFPIDRQMTGDLLAFDGPVVNTHAAIAGVDYILEALSALMVLMTSLGKVLHDLLLWSTSEFRYLILSDEFVQPSSIMPQKRNPVALEHGRAICSRALAQASGTFQMLHNTPFGDIVDVEDDVQPLVRHSFQDSLRTLRLLSATLAGARFDRERMKAACGEGWITVTELADSLVRDQALPFRKAHEIAAAYVRLSSEQGLEGSQALRESSAQILDTPLEYDSDRLEKLLSPSHFVEVRKTLGGPAPEPVNEALRLAEVRLVEDEPWLLKISRRFLEYRDDLRGRARQI